MSSKKNFSESATYRYALALYELSKENSELDKIENQSKDLLNLLKNNLDFQHVAKDLTIKKNEQISAIRIISEKFSFSKIFSKFLCFLASKRRFFFLEKILKSFLDICSKKRGEIKAKLRSSKELNLSEIENIQKELSEDFTSKVKLDYTHDPSLIGGLIIQVGSIMIDTSIKNKLKQLEIKMIEA